MARRGVVVVFQAVERRLLLKAPPAPVLVEAGELRTARPEPAARWRVGRTRQVALEQDPPAGPLLVRVRQRDRREQGLRVRVGRGLVHTCDVADLDDLAE